MNRLLLDERPLIIMPSLAVVIGLPESIFLQQLHYWLEKSTNKKNGHAWVYNTVKEWHDQFPFWSISTIRRIIEKLEREELIITDNFNKLPIDQTKWYRINYEKLNEIDSKSHESRKRETSTQNEQMDCSKRANGLPNLSRPLPESTTESTTNINNNIDDALANQESAFSFYEKNGFGILTPYVGEKIGAWIDDLNEELVLHALKISVDNGAPKWSYAEAILKDWSNKKLLSVSQVDAFETKRKLEQSSRTSRRGSGKVDIIPDWFKEDEPSHEDVSAESDQEEIATKKAELEARLKAMRGETND